MGYYKGDHDLLAVI